MRESILPTTVPYSDLQPFHFRKTLEDNLRQGGESVVVQQPLGVEGTRRAEEIRQVSYGLRTTIVATT